MRVSDTVGMDEFALAESRLGQPLREILTAHFPKLVGAPGLPSVQVALQKAANMCINAESPVLLHSGRIPVTYSVESHR